MKIEVTTQSLDNCMNSALEDLSKFLEEHVLASGSTIKLALPKLDEDEHPEHEEAAQCKIRVVVEITRIYEK